VLVEDVEPADESGIGGDLLLDLPQGQHSIAGPLDCLAGQGVNQRIPFLNQSSAMVDFLRGKALLGEQWQQFLIKATQPSKLL
jgi:hypothetical protein